MGKKDTDEIYYNKSLAVVQANELVRSRQENLTLLEAKLIRLAISQVLKDDSDLKTYRCSVVDLAEFLQISQTDIYRDIQDLSRGLMKKTILIKDKDSKQGYKIFHWIDFVEYKDGTITFQLSESLKPYLLGLNELFTQYNYRDIILLPTTYSIRLYELLESYENVKYSRYIDHTFTDIPLENNEFLFTIDWLREYFNCVDKYSNTGDFIRRIIEPSIQAIEKNTVMRVSYRTIKEKRSIKAIVFQLKNLLDDDELKKFIEMSKKKAEELGDVLK